MNDKLHIPEKIKVGYQRREDTYTKKLAYIIYYDEKGNLKKEKSWRSWCQLEDVKRNKFIKWEDDKNKKNPIYETYIDKGIPANDFNNEAINGFVLNKGVGGVKHSWSSNVRNEYIRVYDPRGFEFEITVHNLLFILAHCDCTKGKGLEGEFVYAWQGSELILLPTSCEEYKNSIIFTSLKFNKINSKELILGGTYMSKNQETLIYLGRHTYLDYYYYTFNNKSYDFNKINSLKSEYIFGISNSSYNKEHGLVSGINKYNLNDISHVIDDKVSEGYLDLLDLKDKDFRFLPYDNFIENEINVLDFNDLANSYYRGNTCDYGYKVDKTYFLKDTENVYIKYDMYVDIEGYRSYFGGDNKILGITFIPKDLLEIIKVGNKIIDIKSKSLSKRKKYQKLKFKTVEEIKFSGLISIVLERDGSRFSFNNKYLRKK